MERVKEHTHTEREVPLSRFSRRAMQGLRGLVLALMAGLSTGSALAQSDNSQEIPPDEMFIWPYEDPTAGDEKKTPPVRQNPIAPLTVDMIPKAQQAPHAEPVEAPVQEHQQEDWRAPYISTHIRSTDDGS